MSPASILATGKDGYVADRDFDERTEKAFAGDEDLFRRDALDLEGFISAALPAVAPVLSRIGRVRNGYRLLDLGCGYGRLTPLLCAFGCAEYLGIDRLEKRLDYARARWGGGRRRFEFADALTFRPDASSGRGGRFDVVWTCHVLQHLLLEDKLRLVETVKRALAPGGAILLCEEEITGGGTREAERRYAARDHAWHMVPMPFARLAEAFRPLEFRRLGGIVYMASE